MSDDAPTTKGNGSMTVQTFTVTGMSCEHCTKSVTEELTELGGVTDVQVSLDDGRVEVTSEQGLTERAAKDAVEEAGYEISNWDVPNGSTAGTN